MRRAVILLALFWAREGHAQGSASARASEAAPAPAPGAEAADPEAAPAPAAAPEPAPAAAPQEVRINGRKGSKSGQTTFGAAEIRQIPGAFGDAFRAVETLPGVTPIVSGVPFFFVRGAPPGNNGYYLDGVRVPLLYHVGLGPSVIHPGLVQRVDFWPGGYPARFGRFVGGILSGETRAPSDTLRAEGNVRLYDAGALVEAPFADGKGTALVSGRYSYTAAIVSLAAPSAVLDYWDYQARVSYAVGPHDKVSVFAFGSYDYVGERRPSGGERTDFSTQFHRVDVRWDRELPAGGRMRLAATLGADVTATGDIRGVRDRMIATRVLVEQPISSAVLLRGGADATFDHYDLSTGYDPDQESLYPPRNDLVAGVHLDAVVRVTPRWEVTPGARLDFFESVTALPSRAAREQANGRIASVDPRLLSRLELAPSTTLVSTFGLTHQPPSFFVPVPGLQIGRLGRGLQKGVQASQGLEVKLPAGFTFTPTVFHQRYLGLNDFTTTCVGDASDASEDDSCIDRRVRGRSVGLEILLKRPLTQKLSGFASYTLSRTTRTTTIPSLVPTDGPSREAEIPGDFDRTHVLNLVGAYDLGRGWRVGARFFFYTGRPYSRRAYGIPIPPYNEERMPDFHRLDGRVEKRWRVGETGSIAFVVEWMNMTLRKEVVGVSCVTQRGQPEALPRYDECTLDEIGPISIPSVGVEGRL